MSNKRLIIVGGVAGGASAAARARRLSEDCEIIMFERGQHVSFANCGLPYCVGGEIAEQDSLLVQTPASLKARFNLDVRINTEVIRVDPMARRIHVRESETGREYAEAYDALVLSTGASPLRPPIPGIERPNHFVVRNIPDVERIRAWSKDCQRLNGMAGFIAKDDRDRIKKTLEAWETFLSEDAKLVVVLIAIRAQASGLSAVVQKDWNILACTLDSYLETLNACAQALRVKLELLKKHSQEDVDKLIETIHSRLPDRAYADALDAESYEQEYRKAATELDQERHKFLGFMDVVKALLMWIETPEERVRKNRSLRVDEAETCEFAA